MNLCRKKSLKKILLLKTKVSKVRTGLTQKVQKMNKNRLVSMRMTRTWLAILTATSLIKVTREIIKALNTGN